MKEVKHISTKTKVLPSADVITTVRAKITGYPRHIIENYPGGRIHKDHVTFRLVNWDVHKDDPMSIHSNWGPCQPDHREPIDWIKDSLEYGMEEQS